MNQSMTIIKREIYSYIYSPVAYIFMVIFLMTCGWFAFDFGNFYNAGQADLRSFFFWHPWLYLIFLPAVAMRLWSEERKSGTVQLLFTLPITVPQAVVGKFVAAWLFLGLTLAFTFPIIITVNYLGNPDNGVIFSSYIGSFLMAGCYLSVGSLTSALTKNQVVSFILSIVILFVLMMMGYGPVLDYLSRVLPVHAVDFIATFGLITHFESIQQGVIDLRDIFYFASFIVVMLVINTVVLESRKAS